MAPRSVIIDCDPGHDDALAILLALGSPEQLDVLALTTVAGNVPLALTERNARKVCELARRLDLSPSSISQIETSKMQPSVRTLYAFASEFGVTVDEVLFDSPQQSEDTSAGSDAATEAPGPGLMVQRAEGRPACWAPARRGEGTRSLRLCL